MYTLEDICALVYIREVRAILRGRFVADSLRGVSANAGIVVDDGVIADVGGFDDLVRDVGTSTVRTYDGILCPALINAHTHLELSALHRERFHHTDFVDWVIKLVDTRASMSSEDMRPDCVHAKQEAEENGTGYFLNVGNDFELNNSLGDNQLFAFEQIGINDSSAEKIFDRSSGLALRKEGTSTALAVHAPYSVSPRLMKAIKSFNNRRGSMTSVHLAETEDEVEFVKSGTGRMMDLLNYRVGKWEFKPSGVSPVKYLDSLGILDQKTLCVHCVCVDEEDVNIIKDRGSAVAVCVRSNLELSGKIPPVGTFLRQGVKILIGTDSRASSPDLNMFAELGAFYSRFHDIMDPRPVFAAATSDAAETIGIGNCYGNIDRGRKASIVYVPFEGKREDVFEYLVSSPDATKVTVEA